MHTPLSDLRLAARVFRRAPSFAVAVTAVLASVSAALSGRRRATSWFEGMKPALLGIGIGAAAARVNPLPFCETEYG